MNENENVQQDEQSIEDINAEALLELRNNTVSKDSYNSLKNEYQKLVKSIATGEELNKIAIEPAPDVNELRREIFINGENLSDIARISKYLQLREALIDSGANDPFLPSGQKIMPSNEDIECANRTASVLQECVDYANGDNAVFLNELQRRMVDTMPNFGKRR